MIREIVTPASITVLILIGGLLWGAGCGNDPFPPADGASRPGSCYEIKALRVLYAESFDQETSICRLELNPPPGFEFVDKGGNRLPYHPFVLVKKGR